MATVAQIEVCSYGGFAFPVESVIDLIKSIRYDQADRAVVSVAHTYTITTTLKTDDLAGRMVGDRQLVGVNEADLDAILAVLDTPALPFTLSGAGLGDLSVNTGNGKWDVSWGPKPRTVSVRLLGTTACELTWVCEINIPTCLDARFRGSLLAYNYSVSTSRDEQGYTTRTISGYLEIPLTDFFADGRVAQGASNYWSGPNIPPVPPMFRRTTSQTTESEDRRKLTFTVVDTECNDVLLPPDVVDCRASHTVQTQKPAVGGRCTATIRASYTLRKGVDKKRAFTYFLILVFEKLRAAIAAGLNAIIPVSLQLDDSDIYGRTAGNFSFTYSYSINATAALAVGAASGGNALVTQLQNLIPASGLWTPGPRVPVGGTQNPNAIQSPQFNSYNQWLTSMRDVFGAGAGEFEYRAGGDVLISLCQGTTPGPAGGMYFRAGDLAFSPVTLLIALRQTTFLKYATAVFIECSPKLVFKPSVGGRMANFFNQSVNRSGLPGVQNTVAQFFSYAESKRIFGDHQVVAPSQVVAYLAYDLIQLGQPPAQPNLTEVGGTKDIRPMPWGFPSVAGNKFVSGDSRSQVSNHFGVPCFRLRGIRAYVLMTVPNGLPSYPPNYYLDGVERTPQPAAFNFPA